MLQPCWHDPMTPAKPHVLCAGLVALDMELSIQDFPVAGLKHRATGSRLRGAGGALNAAAAVVQLGGQATLRSATGDDALADLLMERMRGRGVALDQVHRVAGQITSHSAVLIQPDGERTVVNYRDDSLCDDLPPLPAALSFDAVLCDTRFSALSVPVFVAARAAGKPAVLDAEAPVRLVGDAIKMASHIAFSMQGLSDYAGKADLTSLREVARSLRTWVCVTRGPDPVLCTDGETAYDVAVPHVVAKNTNGAGDYWHAAFTLALARRCDEPAAVRFANEAAARYVAELPVPELQSPMETQ